MRSRAQGEDTRQSILDSAHTLFLRQGYHATSMRQLARETEITPAAIYNHFENKEQIFTTLLQNRLPYVTLVRVIQKAQGDSAEELIYDALQRMRTAMAEQFDNMRLMFIELLEFQGQHIASVAGGFLPQAIAFVERIREKHGGLKPFPTLLIVRALVGLFMSYAISVAFLSQVPGFRDNPADLEALAEMLLWGLLEKDQTD